MRKEKYYIRSSTGVLGDLSKGMRFNVSNLNLNIEDMTILFVFFLRLEKIISQILLTGDPKKESMTFKYS